MNVRMFPGSGLVLRSSHYLAWLESIPSEPLLSELLVEFGGDGEPNSLLSDLDPATHWVLLGLGHELHPISASGHDEAAAFSEAVASGAKTYIGVRSELSLPIPVGAAFAGGLDIPGRDSLATADGGTSSEDFAAAEPTASGQFSSLASWLSGSLSDVGAADPHPDLPSNFPASFEAGPESTLAEWNPETQEVAIENSATCSTDREVAPAPGIDVDPGLGSIDGLIELPPHLMPVQQSGTPDSAAAPPQPKLMSPPEQPEAVSTPDQAGPDAELSPRDRPAIQRMSLDVAVIEPPTASESGAVVEAEQVTMRRSALVSGDAGVVATMCPRSHANPPSATTCRVCRDQVPEQEPARIPTPTLGVLRLPDGTSVPLDRGVIFGRAPQMSSHSAGKRLISTTGYGQYISRVHAEISVSGWHVFVKDLGSTGKTVITNPGADPEALRPHEQVALEPGGELCLAEEYTIRFEV